MGKAFSKKNGHCYTGEFKNGLAPIASYSYEGEDMTRMPFRQGLEAPPSGNTDNDGFVTSWSGDEDDVDWTDCDRHGRGTFTPSCGPRHVELYEDNKKHGLGLETKADGIILDEGVGKDDKPVRDDILTFPVEETCFVSSCALSLLV